MGVEGLRAVANNTIANVVKDLMTWYEVGKKNRMAKSLLMNWICFLIVVNFVALTVVMFAGYDVLVRNSWFMIDV